MEPFRAGGLDQRGLRGDYVTLSSTEAISSWKTRLGLAPTVTDTPSRTIVVNPCEADGDLVGAERHQRRTERAVGLREDGLCVVGAGIAHLHRGARQTDAVLIDDATFDQARGRL